MTAPFLPFTRPAIDAESIAAVAEVFRSGQLASGPKVQAFEAALAAYLGSGRHVRVMTSATAGLEMALEVAGVGEGRRGDRPRDEFRGQRERRGAAAGEAGVRRRRAAFAQYRRRSDRGRDHPQDPSHHAGAFLRVSRWIWMPCSRSRPSMGCG